MDSAAAFALGDANRGKEARVFDWDEAARRIKTARPVTASAGLAGDWEWTGGTIFENGAAVPRDETYVYLASSWAEPELDLDGEVSPCWAWESKTPGWGADTYWSDSARAILAES